jgi:hypothetical protein
LDGGIRISNGGHRRKIILDVYQFCLLFRSPIFWKSDLEASENLVDIVLANDCTKFRASRFRPDLGAQSIHINFAVAEFLH